MDYVSDLFNGVWACPISFGRFFERGQIMRKKWECWKLISEIVFSAIIIMIAYRDRVGFYSWTLYWLTEASRRSLESFYRRVAESLFAIALQQVNMFTWFAVQYTPYIERGICDFLSRCIGLTESLSWASLIKISPFASSPPRAIHYYVLINSASRCVYLSHSSYLHRHMHLLQSILIF